MEYIKLFWEHDLEDEPVVIYYEVDVENERMAVRSIDLFRNGETENISDFYRDVIEILPIPTAEAFNAGEYGQVFRACLITREEFEKVWNAQE